jgi:hypothetical protein
MPQMNEGLPHELVISIQRVLELQPTAESDTLDALSGFNPVNVLNQLFPDGTGVMSSHEASQN